MDRSRLLNIPLCDLSNPLLLNQSNKKMLPTTYRRVSSRIKNIQKIEVESESSMDEETSEDENETPEKMKVESDSSSDGDTSDYEYGHPKKQAKIKIPKREAFRDNEMSEYEKMIQKNRERSLAFLGTLKMDEVKKSFCAAVDNLKPKGPLRIKRPRPSAPPRKSRRLAKQNNINLSEDALFERSVAQAQEESEFKYQELPKVLPFEEAMQGKEIFSKFTNDFSEVDYKGTEESSEYLANFTNMKICQSQIAKVVPSRITALDIHPVRDKIIICAGSKYGHVGFWNINSESNPYVFAPHLQGVSNLKFNPYDSNQIVSSSYDGALRSGDMKKYVFNTLYNESHGICCTYFDILSKTTFIVAQKDGNVAVVDVRASKNSVMKHSCHEYSVKSVSVHPLNKNHFISSEIKGPIKLWDLRKLQQQPVFDLRHHRKSVTSAFFSPCTGNSILSTCLDDSICVFGNSNFNEDIRLKKEIKHNNFTGRWVSTFKAVWVPNTDDTFVVGSMDRPRRIEVYNDNGNNLYNFMNEDLNSVTSLHAFHASIPVLAGGNSSGKVYVYTL